MDRGLSPTMKSTTLYCVPAQPLQCLPTKTAAAPLGVSQRRAFSSSFLSFQHVTANGFLLGDGGLAFCSVKKEGKQRHFLEIRAASKPSKAPPKPATRTAIVASIVVPLLLAGAAVLAGKLLLRRIKAEAREEAEELERRFNPRRLLTDGRSRQDESTEKSEPAESIIVVGTRNRPKREE